MGCVTERRSFFVDKSSARFFPQSPFLRAHAQSTFTVSSNRNLSSFLSTRAVISPRFGIYARARSRNSHYATVAFLTHVHARIEWVNHPEFVRKSALPLHSVCVRRAFNKAHRPLWASASVFIVLPLETLRVHAHDAGLFGDVSAPPLFSSNNHCAGRFWAPTRTVRVCVWRKSLNLTL